MGRRQQPWGLGLGRGRGASHCLFSASRARVRAAPEAAGDTGTVSGPPTGAPGLAHPGHAVPPHSLPLLLQLLPSPGLVGGRFEWEPQVVTSTVGPSRVHAAWGAGYGEAGGKAPALHKLRKKGTVVSATPQPGSAGAAFGQHHRGCSSPQDAAERPGGLHRTAPSPCSGSGSCGSLHTDKLSCGATSAASRALLLIRVCRTGS